jgi:threonine dehydratase
LKKYDPIPLEEIRAAQKRISTDIVRTPLVKLNVDDAPAEIYLKLENLQPIGSFKIRGASNAIKSAKTEDLKNGVRALESSGNCYHVVFNRMVSWSENLSIIGRIVLMTHHRPLQRWHLMQCIKQSMTLRVSIKGDKPIPRIVYSEGEQGEQIEGYLKYSNFIKGI